MKLKTIFEVDAKIDKPIDDSPSSQVDPSGDDPGPVINKLEDEFEDIESNVSDSRNAAGETEDSLAGLENQFSNIRAFIRNLEKWDMSN